MLVATVLCAWILVSLACQGKAQKVERLLASGRAYFEEQKYPEAVIQFKNAVQQDPKSVEGHFELGRCYLRMNNPTEAFKAFSRALDLNPNLREARMQVGNLSLLFGDLIHAEAVGRVMVDQDEGDWEGWVLLARVAMLQQDDEAAGAALAAALSQAPREILPRILQGRLLERKGEADRAGAHYEDLWRQFPESFEVERVLYQFYAAQGRDAEFSALAEQNLPRKAHRVERLSFLAGLYLQMGKPRQAASVLSEALDEEPENPALRLLAGGVFLTGGDAAEAERQWRKGLDLDKGNRRIREGLAELLLRQERLTEAEGEARQLLDQDPGNRDALLLLGRVAFAGKRYGEAQNWFRKVLDRYPGNASAHLLLGMCYASTGERPLAVQNFREALGDPGVGARARRALGELYLQGGELQLAEEMLAPLAAETPPEKDVVILLSEVLRRQGRAGEAMALLEREGASYPVDKAFPLQKGRVRLTMKDPEGAGRFFREALKLDPASQEAVFRLAQITLQKDGPEAAAEWIGSRLPDMVDKAPFYHLLGQIALGQGRPEEAEGYWRRALDADPNQLEGYLALASLYLRLETGDKALQIAADLEAREPKSPAGPMLQGMILESVGKNREAMARYERALSIQPDFAPAANNLAYLLVEERNDVQRALPLAEKARKGLPDNPAVADTLGWVFQKMGLPHKAMNLFLEAVEQMPDHPTVHYHLGVAYASLGKDELARESLARALVISGTFPEADDARRRLGLTGE